MAEGFLARTRRIRIAILLTILLGVLLYAARDIRNRRARNDWDHSLYVALVVVTLEPIDDAAMVALRARVPALEDRLASEMARHRAGAPRPFRFQVRGAVPAPPPPSAPAGDGPVDLAKHSMALSSWVKDVDGRAGVESDFDVRVYLAVRRPRRAERTLVEGRSEQGGHVGLVEVELDADGVDLALTVAAHELMHTLGATDKYDASGRTLVPDGLGDPTQSPLYPQKTADVMARNRMISATREKVPADLGEIAVGPATAREIGWLR